MESRCRRLQGGGRMVCKGCSKVLIFGSQLRTTRGVVGLGKGLLPITELLFLRHSTLSPSTAWVSRVRHVQYNYALHFTDDFTQADCGVVRVAVYNFNPASLLPSILIRSWKRETRTSARAEPYPWITIQICFLFAVRNLRKNFRNKLATFPTLLA